MKTTKLQQARSLHEAAPRCTSSGYKSLDDLTGGLGRGGVTVIGARPGMGSTALAMNIVSRFSQQPGNILVISQHLHPRDGASRLFTIGLGMDTEKLLNGSIPAHTLECRCADFFRAHKGYIHFLVDSFLDTQKLCAHCRDVPDLRLVVVDDLRHICTPRTFSAMPVNETLRCLKALAGELDVPVVGTVCLHRSLERRKNKRPKLSDLKKIDMSAQLPDQVFFLYRDSYYEPFAGEKAEIIVAKNSYGKTGTVELNWHYEAGRFTEIAEEL